MFIVVRLTRYDSVRFRLSACTCIMWIVCSVPMWAVVVELVVLAGKVVGWLAVGEIPLPGDGSIQFGSGWATW